MPKDLTDAVDKELPGFTLNERVEEIKRKLHLRSMIPLIIAHVGDKILLLLIEIKCHALFLIEKESECYKESSRTELLANERIIRMMRSNNQIRRLLFSQDNVFFFVQKL